MKKIYLLLILFSWVNAKGQTVNGHGSSQTPNIIETAVPFLRITPDATAGALGEAGLATAPDVHSIYWNTAKLAFDKDLSGISASYTPWLSSLFAEKFINRFFNDIYLADISGFAKIDSMSAVTASVEYFSLGNLTFTNSNGQTIGSYNPREFTLHAGYSRRLSNHFSLGLNLGYVYSNLASGQSINGVPIKAGKSVMGDLSVFYTHSIREASPLKDYNIGLAIKNLGSKMSYTYSSLNKDFLPANLGLGTSLHLQVADVNNFYIHFDLNKLLVPTPDSSGNYRALSVLQGALHSFGDAPGGVKEELQEITGSLGLEYNYDNIIFLRTGYFYENKYKGDRHYMTVGAGCMFKIVELEFSYIVPLNNLSNFFYFGSYFSGSSLLDNTFHISLSFFLPDKNSLK